jgi:hypothetical protein
MELADSLKEQVIGVAVFDKDPVSFDSRIDPIVRNDARRLRRKLEVYYASEGRSDHLRIEIPKGGYAPVFIETAGPEPLPVAPLQLRKPTWRFSELMKAVVSEPREVELYLLLCRTHVYRHDWEHAITAGMTALHLFS